MPPRHPNLFVIGAMKSGTSTLHEHLAAHPDIFMSTRKEPMYFSHLRNRVRGRRWYMGFFEGAGEERWVGESSTGYTKRPWWNEVAGRIGRFADRPRFVYLLRDPFQRIVSHYRYMVRRGRERRRFGALTERPTEYVTNSYYAYQLEPYVERFGLDAVFVDTMEALTADPTSFCRRLFAWLDVDPDFVPPKPERRLNATPSVVEQKVDGPLVRRISATVAQVPWVGPQLARSTRRWLGRWTVDTRRMDFRSDAFQEEVAEVRSYLAPLLAAWVEELQELTGHDFGEWPVMEVPPRLRSRVPPPGLWLPRSVRSRVV